ncbi:unnamed protein product [Diamesa serratosioi]
MKLFIKLLLGLPVGVTIIDTLGYVARVDGDSMKPTFNPLGNSDYVFLSKFSARNYEVNRGEIVSLISPKDPEQKIIKRVVGTSGDVIQTLGFKEKYVKIPQGYFWIEGDNSSNSLDSNTFGPCSLGLLTAKATHIVWPPNRWQRLECTSLRQPIKYGKKEAIKR